MSRARRTNEARSAGTNPALDTGTRTDRVYAQSMRNDADNTELMRVALDLLETPIKCHQDTTPTSVLADLDYLRCQARVTEAVLQQALRKAPELMEAWAGWSADKRTSSGWYLKQESDQTNQTKERFVVGFLDARSPGPPSHTQVRSYNDPVEAFAAFIKHELDSIAEHLQ